MSDTPLAAALKAAGKDRQPPAGGADGAGAGGAGAGAAGGAAGAGAGEGAAGDGAAGGDEAAKKAAADKAAAEAKAKTDAEAAAAAAKGVAGADPDEEIISGKRSPKGDDFKRVKEAEKAAKQAAKEAAAEVERLRGELATATTGKVDVAEVERIRAELAQAQGLNNMVALEFTPEFKAKFDARRGGIVNNLKSTLAEKDVEEIIPLLELPDSPKKLKQLEEAMAGLSELQKSEVALANRDFRAMRQERETELTGATEKLTKLHTERSEQAGRVKTAMKQAFDGELARAVKEMPLYQKRDGDEAWNAGVDERIAAAQVYFNDQFKTVGDKARFATMAAGLPELIRQNSELIKAVGDRDATITRLTGANPDLKGGAGGAGGGGGAPPKSFRELVVADVKKGGRVP